MRLTWRSERGGLLLESAVVLPLLILLLFGGLLIALSLFVRASLTYHVFREAEETALRPPVVSAASGAAGLIRSDPPAGLRADRHHGFTFGVPLPQDPFAVSAACYSLPLRLPATIQGTLAGPAQPPAVTALPALDRIREAAGEAQRIMDRAEASLDGAEDLVDQVDLALQIVSQAASRRASARRQAIRLVGSWALEAGMQHTCRGDGPWVLTARAVALHEQTKGLR